MNFLAQSLAIAGKDLAAEWHTKERFGSMAFFVLLTLLVFSFSFKAGGAALHETGPGVLWSAFVFASLFGLQRSFATEGENHCLDALRLAPMHPAAIYLGKALGNFIFLALIETLALPFFGLFFNLSPGLYLVPLLGIFALGAACLSSVGTLFAAMCSNQRLGEFMLPLLMVPLIMPALISCVEATALVLANRPLATLYPHLRMLAVYSLVFTVLSLMLFEYILEE
jgi:heme exporter protein B